MDDDLHRGLEDVTVAETRLSEVDGEAGELLIAGYPVEDLAPNATFEEALFLLYEDRLPTREEREEFAADLAGRRHLPDGVLPVLRQAAEEGAPAMDALRAGAAAANLGVERGEGGEGGDDPAEDALTAVARIPTAVAAYWRLANGEEPLEPREDLGHAADYLRMLTGEAPTDAQVAGLETYLCTVVDHGLNASTFTARTIVSTESDVVSAVTGAVGALKGPLHGGAPGPVLDMLRDLAGRDDLEAALRERLEAGERLMGFGHRVYRVRDPRAAVLSTAAERFYDGGASEGAESLFETARRVEAAGVEVLSEHRPDRRLETNVEFYTAVLLDGVGVPRELFTTTFAVGRVGGWTAHCLEQLGDNRLVRPRGRYVGARGRTWTPVDERD